MKLQVTFRNFDHTEALDGIIRKKSAKLKKFASPNAHLTWNCFVDSADQVCEVSLSGFHGPDISAKAKSESLYKTVDMVIDKLEAQLKKRHRMMNAKVHDKRNRNFDQVEAS